MSNPLGSNRKFDHLRLGRYGEDLAAAWYTERGYTIVDRNWRSALGELDLIVARTRPSSNGRTELEIVVVEVKTRSSNRFGTPFEAVGNDKQRRIRRLAAEWLAERRAQSAPMPAVIRCDVVAVTGRRVDVCEAAF